SQVLEWADAVFDVVPEEIQEPHIAEQVQHTAVQKHRRDHCDRVKFGRCESPTPDKIVVIRTAAEIEKYPCVDRDEQPVHPRKAPFTRRVISVRKKHMGPLVSPEPTFTPVTM